MWNAYPITSPSAVPLRNSGRGHDRMAMSRNPFGFVMILLLALWVAYTVLRALKTGEIFSGGMYRFERGESPFMYWMVLVIHVGIVVGLVHSLIHLDQAVP